MVTLSLYRSHYTLCEPDLDASGLQLEAANGPSGSESSAAGATEVDDSEHQTHQADIVESNTAADGSPSSSGSSVVGDHAEVEPGSQTAAYRPPSCGFSSTTKRFTTENTTQLCKGMMFKTMADVLQALEANTEGHAKWQSTSYRRDKRREFGCGFGGEYKNKSLGTRRHQTRKTNCEARATFSFSKNRGTSVELVSCVYKRSCAAVYLCRCM